ncbi:MAG: DNA polymerase III subunit delta' [Oscillospiraceae bacterium]|nr:DNA polymerase III subunit delta' [Oscillospiraceae bacterium]
MNFYGFYGNERAKEYLNSAFARHSFPHALLIYGERGIGKKTLADIVARALVCTGDDVPCGSCNSCYKAKNGTHPDIIRLGGDNDTVKVDEIRALKRDALLRPNDGERKVYIINHAEAMTHQAQDAFLKILEEPPLFTFFIILCYNLSDLLPTIISRTAPVTLSPLSDADMGRVIAEKLPELSSDKRDELIKTSGGVCSFLIEEKNHEFTDIAESIANALCSCDELKIFREFAVLEKRDRDTLLGVIDELTVIIRDALVISSGAESSLISLAGRQCSDRFATAYSTKTSCEIINLLTAAKASCMQNVGVAHIIGSLICKLAYIAANAASKG